MIYFRDDELIDLLEQDVPYLDNTTFGLGIRGVGRAKFYAKKDKIVVCGLEECVRIAKIFGLEIQGYLQAQSAQPQEVILELVGERRELFRIGKTLQNILEYACSVATYTQEMLQAARKVNPKISLLGTRKTMPFAKKLLLKALIMGGGIPHRLGLSDSILVFKEHYLACENFEKSFFDLKNTFKEHKIIVEVESQEFARYCAQLGADVLQCERFNVVELKQMVQELRRDFPHLKFSATGGITHKNIQEFAKSGVDMVVSTSMYRAEILDIKVDFS